MPLSSAFQSPLSEEDISKDASNGHATYRGYGCCFIGWQVWLQYDASDVDSSDAAVEVFTTDGQHLSAPLDLSRLR